MKTKHKAHAGHRGPQAQPPTPTPTPNERLQGLLERNLIQIAECARSKGLPEGSAVLIQFTGSRWHAYCVDMDSAMQLARGVGPGTEQSFTLMSLAAMIAGDVPTLVVWTDPDSDSFASATTIIHRN